MIPIGVMHNHGHTCENSLGTKCLTWHLRGHHLLFARMEQIPAFMKDFYKGCCYLPQTEDQIPAQEPQSHRSCSQQPPRTDSSQHHSYPHTKPQQPLPWRGLQSFPCASSLSSGCPCLQALSPLALLQNEPLCGKTHIPQISKRLPV